MKEHIERLFMLRRNAAMFLKSCRLLCMVVDPNTVHSA